MTRLPRSRFTPACLGHTILVSLALLCCLLGTQSHAQTPALAAPCVLSYEGSGQEGGFFKYSGTGELRWSHTAERYQASLEMHALGLRLRQWNSSGTLDSQGLAPEQFEDVPRGAHWTTTFQRDQGTIRFSSGTPEAPLQAGAQDKLSALLQLGALLATHANYASPGSTISFQAADAHGAEPWSFSTSAPVSLNLPGGNLIAIQLTKSPSPSSDQTIEVWLAPAMGYLPVRLRITEHNGNYMDLMWLKTQKPA